MNPEGMTMVDGIVFLIFLGFTIFGFIISLYIDSRGDK